MFAHSTFLLWAATTALKLIICVCAWRTKNYPWFRAYITFSAVKSVVLWCLALCGPEVWYARIYFPASRIEAILLLFVLGSFGMMLFAPFKILPTKIYRVGRNSGIFLLVAVGTNALLSYHGTTNLTKTIERADYLFSLVLVSFLAVLSRYLGIPWRSRAAWLAFGLFVYLTLFTFNPHSNVAPMAYLIGELIWLAGYLRPEPYMKLDSEQIEALKGIASGWRETA